MIINPRRPLDNDNPEGYQESDIDYMTNNREACIAFLDGRVARQEHIRQLIQTEIALEKQRRAQKQQ